VCAAAAARVVAEDDQGEEVPGCPLNGDNHPSGSLWVHSSWPSLTTA
jgi:hypothetical protein